MTSTQKWNSNDQLPPVGNEDVARIMSERNVGRKRAYTILKRDRAAQFTNEVPETQRAQVLHILVQDPRVRNVAALVKALHAANIKTDAHDAVKTLWALQKTRYVRFREHGSHDLYAISVTDGGIEAYGAMMRERAVIEVRTVDPDAARVADQIMTEAAQRHNGEAASLELPVEPFVDQAVADAELDEAEQAEGAHTAKPSTLTLPEDLPETPLPEPVEEDRAAITRPWIKGNLGGWPAIRDVRDRAVKAEKINAAAKLLEEAGEDEVALSLMTKTEFTSLEEEIISLLKAWEEL